MNEFDNLLDEVQGFGPDGDITPIKELLSSANVNSRQELDRLMKTQLSTYLDGTLPRWKWILGCAFFFAILMPILGVSPFYKIRTFSDSAVVQVVRWKGGGSWTAGAWLLWVPSLVLFVVYKPNSLRIEDIFNCLFLYYTYNGIIFNTWTSGWRFRDGFEMFYKFYEDVFTACYIPIRVNNDMSDVTHYLNMLTAGNHVAKSLVFKPEFFDERFLKFKSQGRRQS